MYCTIDDVRELGVPAGTTDADVLARIATARGLIDRYTGALWEPTEVTVVGRAGRDGTVLLPYQVRSVTAVTPVGSSSAIAPSGYLVLSSSLPGQIDAVVIGVRGSDMLVAGAEPYRGGWGSLLGGLATGGQVAVEGVFGTEETPLVVQQACATLAAWLLNDGSLVPPGPGVPGAGSGIATDDEGNVVSITVNAPGGSVAPSRTTGLESVDAALVGLRREHVGIN